MILLSSYIILDETYKNINFQVMLHNIIIIISLIEKFKWNPVRLSGCQQFHLRTLS